jgi:hypothetical protein
MEDVASDEEDIPVPPAAPPVTKRPKKQDPGQAKPQTLPKQVTPNPNIPFPPKSKLMSRATKDFNSESFLQKLCSTPVTITLSEVLGSSPLMAKKMQDYLRITRLPSSNTAEQVNSIGQSAMYHPNDARLIKIRMTLDNDITINTLIDCGSELDIINRQTCIKGQIPIDTSVTTYMRDAGQHDTRMEGRCHEVQLTAGNLVTVTDLWVGSKLPFALLLGRPWQRKNRISIDERETGTWLCRRDPHDKKIWETCVIPASHAEDFFDSFNGNFFGQDQMPLDLYLAHRTMNPNPDDKKTDTDNP